MTDIHSTPPNPSIASAPTLEGEYVADPSHSELRFKAKAFTLAWVRGTIPALSGSIRIVDGMLSGTGAIAADKVTTGLTPRDWHLRSSHYLHVKKHPSIELSVADADIASGTAECTVTVRGVASSVPMTIRRLEVVDGALCLDAAVELDRTPYPMLPPLAGVSRVVHVELTIVARSA